MQTELAKSHKTAGKCSCLLSVLFKKIILQQTLVLNNKWILDHKSKDERRTGVSIITEHKHFSALLHLISRSLSARVMIMEQFLAGKKHREGFIQNYIDFSIFCKIYLVYIQNILCRRL